MSYYVISIMKGFLICQIVDVINAMKKEDVITINLLGLIEEVLAIILLDMIDHSKNSLRI